MSVVETDILFTDFVKLLHSISCVTSKENHSKSFPSLDLVKRWILMLKQHNPCVPINSCKLFFRLLFPEEDVRRRFHIQETTLAKALVQIFSLSADGEGAGGKRLLEWSEVETRKNVGCLGIEVERVLLLRHSESRNVLTFREVDRLLDELASLSIYSHPDIRKQRHSSRSRLTVLKNIFATMGPSEAKFMTQIILKDLRPVLYPMQEINTTRALLHHKSNEIHVLTKWEVMRAWHPSLPNIYLARATLDAASGTLEDSGFQITSITCSPVLGVPIEIPKSQKGRSLSHALKFFTGESEIWAETKYDGERMQIHIDLSKSYDEQITIFSKSKRDSTLDRIGTHSIIRAALSLPFKDDGSYPHLLSRVKSDRSPRFQHSVILDAEMVAYSEKEKSIDEFWRIRSLVESTASGARSVKQRAKEIPDPHSLGGSQSTQTSDVHNSYLEHVEDSLISNASDCSTRHLKVVFFDVMFIDGCSLLTENYRIRRDQLERLVNPVLGFVSLSWREKLDSSHDAVRTVAHVLAEHIANYQEGIVLKGATSIYNDSAQPWVKLKKDYIPGYGDTIDLVLIGASWNKSRARELRVAPQTFTSFFVGALKATNIKTERPDIQVLFVVEYGMSREELETLNAHIKHVGYHTYPLNGTECLPYDFSLPGALSIKPAIVFMQPLLGELFGAGFTKDSGILHYSLRFPRLTKIWRSVERSWTTGTSLQEFRHLARSAIGHESSDDWAQRSIENIWGGQARPPPRDQSVIEKSFSDWYDRFLSLEKLPNFGEILPRDLKRRLDVEDHSLKRTKVQDRRNLFGIEGPTALSQSQAHVKEFNHNSLVTTMKRMIPMSPGTQAVRNDRVVMVDVAQMLTTRSRNATLEYPERRSLRSSDLSFESEISEAVTTEGHASSNSGDHSSRPGWKTPSIIKYIQDAYVWIPKNRQGRRPATRPPASNIIPYGRRIGVIYFLLIICGCRVEVDGVVFEANSEQFEQARKCVIFVDTGGEPDTREALQWLMVALGSWKRELNKKGSKELLVFDSNLLTYEAMSSLPSQDDIEVAALWRSHNP